MVKKIIFDKYWLVNLVVKLNQVIIRDPNLLFSVDKFLENFASIKGFNRFYNLFESYKNYYYALKSYQFSSIF